MRCMATITVEPATSDRWDDVQAALTGGGDGRSCQCAWWTLRNADFNRSPAEEKQELLADEIAAGPPPGLIAYVDGAAAGWVRVGPRPSQMRIARTRNIVTATREPLDDPEVWAITCFSVRREHRGIGVTTALLDAAVDHARTGGARVVEAYPVDTGGEKQSSNALFTGALRPFLAAGFQEVAERRPGHPLVTKDLR